MNSVLLPREWNSPSVPPTKFEPVFVTFGRQDYDIFCYDPETKEWCDTLNGDAVFQDNEEAKESIKGWAPIVQR